jgi:hypothetical protein
MNFYSKAMKDGASLQIGPLTSSVAQHIYTDFDLTSKYCLYRSISTGSNKSIEVLAAIPDDDSAFQMSLLLGLD